ncbi:MAG TPA: hypothetical protein VHB97_06415 [Polyangia bacterium]|jgi:hypothetical protein|nr:hypothetical protein [Polyangia bacterium]
MRAEDILPDAVNEAAFDGMRVRKGSVAAFLANARLLVDDAAPAATRAEAEAHIAELVPALMALGLFDVLEIRDPRVAAVVARHTPRP